MDELKADLGTMKAHLGEMETSQRMTLGEIAGLKSGMHATQSAMKSMQRAMQTMQSAMQSVESNIARLWTHVEHLHNATTATQGTFASIETHMIKLFEEQAEVRSWRTGIEARVDALEKRQPPAA